MDIKRINQIYEELGKYSIELANDPTVMGPQYILRITSECRNYLNSVTRILLEIHRDKQNISNTLNRLRAVFAIQSAELLATNTDVMRRPNIRDREAAIRVLLKTDVDAIEEAETDLRNLDAIAIAVKLTHAELVRTDGQIRTQRSAIQDELRTKSFYGDESNLSPPIDDKELEDLMSGHTPPEREPQKAATQIFTAPEDIPLDEVLPPSQVVPDRPAKVEQTKEPEPVKALSEPESDLEAALALVVAEEAPVAAPVQEKEVAVTVQQPTLPEASVPVEKTPDSVADVEAFLSAPTPSETTSETVKTPAKRTRKTAAKEEAVAQPVVSKQDDDIDFESLLANM